MTTQCYICTKAAVIKLQQIPYCGACAPRPPKETPEPKPTPKMPTFADIRDSLLTYADRSAK